MTTSPADQGALDPTISLARLQAERLFVELFKRLKPLSDKHHEVSLSLAIRTAKEIAQNDDLLATIHKESCHECLATVELLDAREQNFKRLIMQHVMRICQQSEVSIGRVWLLHFIEMLEIALGQYRFESSEEACVRIVEQMKEANQFSYMNFFEHPQALIEYSVLMIALAVFLEDNPKHRIDWLLTSMESIPSTHIDHGMVVHDHQHTPIPSHDQLVSLLTSVFEELLDYIRQASLQTVISERLPNLKRPVESLLTTLIADISALH